MIEVRVQAVGCEQSGDAVTFESVNHGHWIGIGHELGRRLAAYSEVPAVELVEAIEEVTGWRLGPFVDLDGAAEITGLSASTLRQYKSREPNGHHFPPADWVVGQAKLWRLSTVQAWAETRPDRAERDVC